MKLNCIKQALFMAVVAAGLLAGCQKEGGPVTLGVITEGVGGNGPKMVMDGYTPVWEAGDQVRVNNETAGIQIVDNAPMLVVRDDPGSFRAFYPASFLSGTPDLASSSSVNVTLPDIQNYQVDAGGSQKVAIPMGAFLDGSTGTLQFNNCCSLVKLTVTNAGVDATLSSIELKSSTAYLCGTGTVMVDGTDRGIVLDRSLGKKVTLSLGTGVELARNTSKDFYFIVSPITTASTMTFVIHDDGDNEYQKTTTSTITLGRNQVASASVSIAPVAIPTAPASNQIWYTSSNNQPISFSSMNPSPISNEYNRAIGCCVLTFRNNVTAIAEGTFSSQNSLTTVTLPGCVTSIGKEAFSWCTNLTSVNIPDGVTSIGERTFYNCSNLSAITLPNSVTSIGKQAFEYCRYLSSITLPNSVTSIGRQAFRYCDYLRSISLPSSVTSIGNAAFSNCSSLSSVTILGGVTSIGDSVFSQCAHLSSVTIPSSVTSIGSYAFHQCYLTSISLPGNLASIGNYAFSQCTYLHSFTIPSSVTSIGDYAFSQCTYLDYLTLPSNATSIGNGVFNGCTRLASIEIPSGVTSIGDNAFSGCTSLATVKCRPSYPPALGSNALPDTSVVQHIYVPTSSSVNAYKTASGWSDYADKIQWGSK